MDNLKKASSKLCKSLAPEDIRPGQYVVVLHTISEHFPFCSMFDSGFGLPTSPAPKRMQWLPSGKHLPLRVRAVCLPFVLIEEPSGDSRSLDIRQCRLARLSNSYALDAWTCAATQAKRDKKKDDDDDDDDD